MCNKKGEKKISKIKGTYRFNYKDLYNKLRNDNLELQVLNGDHEYHFLIMHV